MGFEPNAIPSKPAPVLTLVFALHDPARLLITNQGRSYGKGEDSTAARVAAPHKDWRDAGQKDEATESGEGEAA